MNDETRVCISLLMPTSVEHRLVDFLLGLEPPGLDFTLQTVAAHGPRNPMEGGDDQVRGHALRTELRLLMAASRCESLLRSMEPLLLGTGTLYWVAPVIRSGQFADTHLQSPNEEIAR